MYSCFLGVTSIWKDSRSLKNYESGQNEIHIAIHEEHVRERGEREGGGRQRACMRVCATSNIIRSRKKVPLFLGPAIFIGGSFCIGNPTFMSNSTGIENLWLLENESTRGLSHVTERTQFGPRAGSRSIARSVLSAQKFDTNRGKIST